MILSPLQVQIVANAEPFQRAIRNALEQIARLSPAVWRAAEALEAFRAEQQRAKVRRRVRMVTRVKQRNRW